MKNWREFGTLCKSNELIAQGNTLGLKDISWEGSC